MDNNNSDEPVNNQVDRTHEQFRATTVNDQPAAPIKKSRNRLKLVLIVVLCLFCLSLIPTAYYMGRMNAVDALADNSNDPKANSPRKSTDTKPIADDTKETPAVTDQYNGWSTYANPVHAYSFKYPADWLVNRNVIQDQLDWVSINPAGEANPGSNDLMAIYTYLDGTGCGEIKERQFSVAGFDVTGVAQCDDPNYRVNMENSKGTRVVVQINTSRGEDETVKLILKSITGLSPLETNR